jgi:tetratricopeptide (TPR) repeat protein
LSGEALYERYKDALRRGHVASLRGRLEEALTAYAEAAAIAPERATPHTSAGNALMRRKRPADAVRHYTAAVRLAPRDEAALLGRAQALAALDKRPQAADAYDAVAEVQAISGKLADAVDSERRALELAEGRERRRTLERLVERLRATEPAEPGRVALEKALVVLEGRAIEPRKAAPPKGAAPAKRAAGDRGIDADVVAAVAAKSNRPVAERPPAEAPEPAADAPAPELASEPAVTDASAHQPASDEAQAPAPAEPEAAESPAPAYRPALDRDLPPDLDVAALALSAESTLERRLPGVGLDELLDLASAYRRDGQADAALDTCYLALSVAPDDVGLHLALVQLYDERGWNTLATEKLDLLDRMVALDEDPERAGLVAGARGARG